jgi:hypothetical protein
MELASVTAYYCGRAVILVVPNLSGLFCPSIVKTV